MLRKEGPSLGKRLVLLAWILWSGVETTAGPIWNEIGTSYSSRSACHDEGAAVMSTEWERRMKNEGLEPVRKGTDVITRLKGGSIALVHFVCLPDTSDPRQK